MLATVGILTLFVSCKNYTVAVDSFREQMTRPGNDQLREVEINNPMPYTYTNIRYEANSIDSITVIDKKGQPVRIENSPTAGNEDHPQKREKIHPVVRYSDSRK